MSDTKYSFYETSSGYKITGKDNTFIVLAGGATVPLGNYALDTTVVHKTGDEQMWGVKRSDSAFVREGDNVRIIKNPKSYYEGGTKTGVVIVTLPLGSGPRIMDIKLSFQAYGDSGQAEIRVTGYWLGSSFHPNNKGATVIRNNSASTALFDTIRTGRDSAGNPVIMFGTETSVIHTYSTLVIDEAIYRFSGFNNPLNDTGYSVVAGIKDAAWATYIVDQNIVIQFLNHDHSNRAFLDVINQNLGTTHSPTFVTPVVTSLLTSRLGTYGTYVSTQTQGIWSMGALYGVTDLTSLGSLYGIGYSYIDVGGSSTANNHQIHFASQGVARASISLTNGNIRTSGTIAKVGGTSSQFLKADGSLDATVYAPNSSLGNYLPLVGGTMAGVINLNRQSGGVETGLAWWNNTYKAWRMYMANPGVNSGPVGITAPTGQLVTSYALRSYIESTNGYGWTFESAANSVTPVVKAEIRSSDGAARFGSVSIYGGAATQFLKADGSTDTSTYATQTWVESGGRTPNGSSSLDTADLDTVTIPGFYNQLANVNATLLRNYPSAGLQAGSLRVYRTTTGAVVQEYHTLSSNLLFTRRYYGTWSSWKRIIDSEDNVVTNSHTHSNKAFLDTVVATTLVTNLNVDLLDGQHGAYYLNWVNLTAKPDFHAVATSGSYLDLDDTPTPYSAGIIVDITSGDTTPKVWSGEILKEHFDGYISTTHVVNNIISTDINNWDAAYNFGIRINEVFDTTAGHGLLLSDDWIGGESGLVHHTESSMVAGISGDYYRYGGTAISGYLNGINIYKTNQAVGIGILNDGSAGYKLMVSGASYSTGIFSTPIGFVNTTHNSAQKVLVSDGTVANTNIDVINDSGTLRIQDYYEDIGGSIVFNGDNHPHKLVHLHSGSGDIYLEGLKVGQRIVIMNRSGSSQNISIDNTVHFTIDSNYKVTLYMGSGEAFFYDHTPFERITF